MLSLTPPNETDNILRRFYMFQAQNYDPAGEFVAYWLPELRALPREKRHAPGMMYLKPIVALKHGYTKKTGDPKNAFSARRGRPEDNRRKRYIDGRTY